jgi:hypothetical protein
MKQNHQWSPLRQEPEAPNNNAIYGETQRIHHRLEPGHYMSPD